MVLSSVGVGGKLQRIGEETNVEPTCQVSKNLPGLAPRSESVSTRIRCTICYFSIPPKLPYHGIIRLVCLCPISAASALRAEQAEKSGFMVLQLPLMAGDDRFTQFHRFHGVVDGAPGFGVVEDTIDKVACLIEGWPAD